MKSPHEATSFILCDTRIKVPNTQLCHKKKKKAKKNLLAKCISFSDFSEPTAVALDIKNKLI